MLKFKRQYVKTVASVSPPHYNFSDLIQIFIRFVYPLIILPLVRTNLMKKTGKEFCQLARLVQFNCNDSFQDL